MSLDALEVGKATGALLSYLADRDEKESNLFDEDDFICLIIALKKVPEKAKVKPVRIPLTHSLYQGSSICVFTKDPQREYKEKFNASPVEGVEKIIGVTKLRQKYSQYKDKRDLLSNYDLFLADERIVPMLSPLLGKKFFQKKKHPIPVNLTRNIPTEVARARDSAHFFLSAGPTLMVKIARTTFSKKQVLDNILGSIDDIVGKIPKKWKNVQAIYIRTHDSVALPIYNNLPQITKFDDSFTPNESDGREEDIAPSNSKSATSKKKKTPNKSAGAKGSASKKRKSVLSTQGSVAKVLKKSNKK